MKRRWFIAIALILIIITQMIVAIATPTEEDNLEQIYPEQSPSPTLTSEKKVLIDNVEETTYTSIQEAINNAPSGSILNIHPGTYNEILTINKEITIIGENKDNTIIHATSKQNGYAIKIKKPGVTLKNLGITNDGPGLYTSAIHISATDTTITNCDIYDTPIGIAIWTSDNTISKTIFHGCSDEGIALLGSSASKCDNNLITECDFYNNCDGIELQYASHNIISDCKIYKNTHSGIDAIANSNDYNTIINCDIYDNEVNGIYITSSSHNTIKNCNLNNNNNGEIHTIRTTETTLTDCVIDQKSVIYVNDQSTISIKNCGVQEKNIKTRNSEYIIHDEPTLAESSPTEKEPELLEEKDNSKDNILSNIQELVKNLLEKLFSK